MELHSNMQFTPCTTDGCGGELLFLDDMVAEAVVLLNGKGYATGDSCGGHFGRDVISFYVSFAEGSTPPLAALPDDFVVVSRDRDSIHTRHKDWADGPQTPQVMRVSQTFLAWVITLPKANEQGEVGVIPEAFWRVVEGVHQTYCARQVALRGPFPSVQDAAADATAQGYKFGEVEFIDGQSREVVDVPILPTPQMSFIPPIPLEVQPLA